MAAPRIYVQCAFMAVPGPSASHAEKKVLLVEDDPLVQEWVKAILEPAGYTVSAVDSIQAARQAVAQDFHPIAILDRRLADGDGLALCADLRSPNNPRRVYVLVLSTRDTVLDVGEGLRAGADAYLSKRTSEAELLAYLDAAVLANEFVARSKGRS